MATSITTVTAKEIAELSKTSGHKLLSKQLNYDKYDETNDIRSAVHTDFVYDNLMFAVEKGFPWEHVCAIANFSSDILQESIGKELPESLKYLKLQSFELTPILGERNFKVYMEQLFTTFMHHFKLFQYVFTKNRQVTKPHLQLKVNTVADIPKLNEGKTTDIWEYEQQYRKLEQTEAERVNKKLCEKSKVVAKTEGEKEKKLKDLSEMKSPLTKEVVGNIIQDVLKTYSTAIIEKIQCDIETVSEDLESKLERTSLPRPQALGTPPRFDLKPKTPMATPPKPKTPPKSPKSGRKKSGSASRSRSRTSKT